MARVDAKSAVITDLDASPKKEATAGEGRAGFIKQVDDVVAVSATDLVSTITSNNGSTFRLCRFPTQAKVKKVTLASDASLDSNSTATVAFQVGVAFSDAGNDGVLKDYVGLVPSSTLTGVVPVVYSSATVNSMFGTITNADAPTTDVMPEIDITFGAISAKGQAGAIGGSNQYALTGGTYTFAASMSPLWSFFGYVDGRGNPQDPGGYFDLFIRNSVVAATGAAANIRGVVQYVI